MKRSRVGQWSLVWSCLLGTCGWIQAQPVNSWNSSTGGNWDDASSWSLGIPPGSSQAVIFTNAYWKAITIDSSTVSSAPQSLAVKSLTILSLSPTNGLYTSRNTLLLNYAGAGNPLVIGVDTNNPGSLLVDHDSTMAMYSSGLIVNNSLGETNSRIGEFQVDGTFIQSDNSEVVAGFLDLNGTYSMTNGDLFVGTQFINGTFNQQGGRNLGSVDLETTNSDYELFDGVVQGDVAVRAGTFHQLGGTNSATLITGWRGVYNLAGGVLMPGDLVVGSPPQNFLQFAGGGIEQTGGALNAGNLSISFGWYDLRGGTLSATSFTLTTNTSVGSLYAGHFSQYGGYHTNGGVAMIGGMNEENVSVGSTYTLEGGTLETPFISANLSGFNHNIGTNRVGSISMSNNSTYVINSGLLAVDQIQLDGSLFSDNGGAMTGTRNVTFGNGAYWYEWRAAAQLGQLTLVSDTNSFLYLLGNPCVLQFASSSGALWADGAHLTIPSWAGSLDGGGNQQLFFGTTAAGLTSQQLSQVQFINPAGLPSGTYGARILSDGEVVPDTGSSSSGPVNSWITPGSGNWDQSSNWYLGVLPDSSQWVLIANPVWKAVAINPSTPINFPGSMTVTNLFIEGATNTENTLLLNNFGTDIPLTVLNGLMLKDGAQILNFNSGLVVAGGTFIVTNSDIIQDGGFIRTTNAPMFLSGSTFDITNGVFEGGSVSIGYPEPARLNQYGGSVRIANLGLASFLGGAIDNGISLYGGTLDLPGGMFLFGQAGGVSYFQSGGTNRTGQVTIEPNYGGWVGGFTLNGGLLADSGVQLMAGYRTSIHIDQNGGSHIITNTLFMAGSSANGYSVDPATYNLNGGALFVGVIELDADNGDAVFVQSNATTSAGAIYTHSLGFYSGHNTGINLLGGTLSCANYTNIDGGGRLNQSGGALVVSNSFDFGGTRDVGTTIYGRYTFTGGTLVASNINIGSDWVIGDGTTNRISNPGTVRLGHTLVISNAVEQLGRFVLPATTSIYISGSSSRLSFANSSGETWAGGATLMIFNWNGNPSGGGATQVKFGADQSGLTPAQLNQIRFRITTNLYSAKILGTGEVVPDQMIAPPLTFSQQGNQFTLYWLPGYRLQTATEPAGPYENVFDPQIYNITSPYTYDMTGDARRFFRIVPQ